MTLQLNIELPSTPVFVYPNSNLRDNGSQNESLAGSSRDETVVHGSVRVIASERTLVGKMEVVWEVGVSRKSLRPYGRDWSQKEILKRFVVAVGRDGMWIDKGTTTFQFIFVLPSNLPPTRSTPFDAFTHTVHATLPCHLPRYSPSPSLSPLSVPTSPEITARRPSISRNTSSSSIDSIASIRNNLGGGLDAKEKRPMLKSLFGKKMGRPRSATTPSPSSLAPLPLGRHRSASTPALIEVVDRGETAVSEYRAVKVVSSLELREQLSTLKWGLNQEVRGLGSLAIEAQSGLFVIGSGYNLSISLTNLSPLTTIHGIVASLTQAITSDGVPTPEIQTETFKLFRTGATRSAAHRRKPVPGTYIWRGLDARTIDACTIVVPGTPAMEVADQVDVEHMISDESSLHFQGIVRLPTSDLGLHSTSLSPDSVIPNATRPMVEASKIVHHLRFEIYHSQLGEDEAGNPLPLIRGRSGRKDVPIEGGMRRTWVDRKVRLGDCRLPPKTDLPLYTPPPQACPRYSLDLSVEPEEVEEEERCVCHMPPGEILEMINGFMPREGRNADGGATPVLESSAAQGVGRSYFGAKGVAAVVERLESVSV